MEILYNNNINKIVLSNHLKENDELINELYAQNLSILNGKNLFKIMLMECLDYIADKCKKDIKSVELTILANEFSEYLMENTMLLAEKVKTLSIVTNNVDKFRKLEEKIRDKFGIIIRISNNKRKSLSQSKIIVNYDFPEELINQYNINKNAILINLNKKIKIKSKKFSGINICDYILGFNNKVFENMECRTINNFNKKELYESMIIKERNLFEAFNRIKEDKVRIIGLIGNNGRINEKEYINFM